MLQHNGAAAVRAAINNARDVEPRAAVWPEPDFGLLGADKAIAPELAPETLPAPIMDWCQATADACAAPVDYVVANLLGAASGWLGNARRILATPGWIEPPHLWFACIGSPSTGKTPAERPFVEACRDLESGDEEAWKATLATHERDMERAKAKSDDWKAQVRDAVKLGSAAPDLPSDAVLPELPIRPRTMIADATVQEIGNILAGNLRGLLQIRDELSGWLGAMDQFSGAGSDRAFYLESWNGGAYSIDRVKHGAHPVRVPYCSLSIMGGLQPDKLKEALNAADDGLAARFLFVWPDPVPYRDLNIEHDEAAAARRHTLARAAERLYRLTFDRSDRGESVPRVLRIAADGFVLLNDIRRDAIHRARAAHGLAAGWHGKTPARALRLALVIEYLAWAMAETDGSEPGIVTGQSVAHAGAFLDYAADMFERTLAGLQIDGAESNAATVARMIFKEKPDKLNERVLYQRAGFSFLRDKAVRVATFDALAEAGFIKAAPTTSSHRPRGDWLVNPSIKEHRA